MSSDKKTDPVSDHCPQESPIRVLVIEDNAAQAFLIQQMLRPTASTTFICSASIASAAGIQQLEERPFDVVLLDLMLPDSAGLDSLLRVYARYPEIPIVVLTGIDDERIVPKHSAKGRKTI